MGQSDAQKRRTLEKSKTWGEGKKARSIKQRSEEGKRNKCAALLYRAMVRDKSAG